MDPLLLHCKKRLTCIFRLDSQTQLLGRLLPAGELTIRKRLEADWVEGRLGIDAEENCEGATQGIDAEEKCEGRAFEGAFPMPTLGNPEPAWPTHFSTVSIT